jgi:hypothetical protein
MKIMTATGSAVVPRRRERLSARDGSRCSMPSASESTCDARSNLTALILRRHFGCELLRTTGAAMLSSVNYYTSNSPA